MTEPLSDETLDEYAEVAEIWRENMVARPEHWSETAAEAIPALLAEVARLKAELAESNRFRDAYKRAKAENDDRFMGERDEAREEFARLKARESDLIADIEMFGVAMRQLVLGRIGEDVPKADEIAEIVRRAAAKTEAEWKALEAENATLRRELDAATAALEAQGQAAFIAGMRTKAQGEASDVPHSL